MRDGFKSGILIIGGVFVQRTDEANGAVLASDAINFARHLFSAFEHFRDDEMQLRICCGGQLALGNNLANFVLDLFGQCTIFFGGQAIFVDVVQRRCHHLPDIAHRLTQGRIRFPFFSVVQL